MARSNLANGGNTYVDLVIQVIATSNDSYTLRAVQYLKSLNVVDSNNNDSVGGGYFSRSGTLALNGVYNATPVWYQDIIVNRVVGSTVTVTVNMSWSGVEYWATTLTASESYIVPAKLTVPSAPTGYSATSITTTEATTTGVTVSNNGGSTLTDLQAEVNTSESATGATTFTKGSYADITMTGRTRFTQYYFRLRAKNAIGWSTWGAWVGFKTLAEIPVMGTSYTAGALTRNSATITGLSVTDNGGQAPLDARVQYNSTASATGASVVTKGSWGEVTVPGLDAFSQYYYRCGAYNSAGWSAYPETWKSFTTLDDAPDDMAPPTFSSVTNTSMRAEWTAPNMNGASFVAYRYEVSLVDTFASTVLTGTTTNLYIDITGLIPGTHYYVRVRANATPNNGGYGTASQLTTGFAPNSGLRVYACIDEVIYQGELYTFIGGVRKKLRVMYAHDGILETE